MKTILYTTFFLFAAHAVYSAYLLTPMFNNLCTDADYQQGVTIIPYACTYRKGRNSYSQGSCQANKLVEQLCSDPTFCDNAGTLCTPGGNISLGCSKDGYKSCMDDWVPLPSLLGTDRYLTILHSDISYCRNPIIYNVYPLYKCLQTGIPLFPSMYVDCTNNTISRFTDSNCVELGSQEQFDITPDCYGTIDFECTNP